MITHARLTSTSSAKENNVLNQFFSKSHPKLSWQSLVEDSKTNLPFRCSALAFDTHLAFSKDDEVKASNDFCKEEVLCISNCVNVNSSIQTRSWTWKVQGSVAELFEAYLLHLPRVNDENNVIDGHTGLSNVGRKNLQQTHMPDIPKKQSFLTVVFYGVFPLQSCSTAHGMRWNLSLQVRTDARRMMTLVLPRKSVAMRSCCCVCYFHFSDADGNLFSRFLRSLLIFIS